MKITLFILTSSMNTPNIKIYEIVQNIFKRNQKFRFIPSNRDNEDTATFAKKSIKSPTELIAAILSEFSTTIAKAF